MNHLILSSVIPVNRSGPDPWPLMFFAVLAVIALIYESWKWLQGRRALRWPTTSGRIESAAASHKPHYRSRFSWKDDETGWTGEIEYSYRVNGKQYSGKYQRAFSIESYADEFLRDLAEKPIRVGFNPAKPDKSIVSDADVDSVLASRHIVSPESTQLNARVFPVPGWAQPILWVLFLLASFGAVLSYVVLRTYEDYSPQLHEYLGVLGRSAWVVAILSLAAGQIVWARAVMVRKDYFWKQALGDCRRWTKWLVTVLCMNVLFNLIYILNPFESHPDGILQSISEADWHVGFLAPMVIFMGSALVLYPLAKAAPRRCTNGHWLQRGLSTCPRCGAPVAR